MKKIEKTYAFKMDEYVLPTLNKIYIVGCGGNGSHVVSDIARLMASMKKDKDIEMILIDGDVVEEKNLLRQHFVRSDLGKNKAEALALRYASAYNVPISYYPEYLTRENLEKVLPKTYDPSPQIIITCTDNIRSRKLVNDLGRHIWIDLGNEEFGGQVTFSSMYNPPLWSRTAIPNGECFITPTVFELFPEYDEKLKKEKPVVISCAEIAEASPIQAGFVNVTAAAIAKNYVHAVLACREIKTFQVFFSIDNTFEHRSITKSAVEKWIENYRRFSHYTL